MIFLQRKYSGFTLIEILVSIAIFAVIAAGVASTMTQMNRLTKKARIKEATIMSAEVALERMQRDLQMAFNERIQHTPSLFKAGDTNGPELTFSFLDNEIKTLFQKRTPGVSIAHYTAEKADNGTLNIMRATAPLYLYDKIKDQPSTLIATGVLEWKVEFYDSRNDLWLGQWDTDAPSTIGAFPRAVRITIKTIDPTIPTQDWKDKALTLTTEFLILNEFEATL